MYLEWERFSAFVSAHFGSEAQRSARLVGADREHDSLYYDIVRFFGTSAVDPTSVKLKYEQSPFEIADPAVAEFAREIAAEMKSAGRLYEGPRCARLVDLSLSTPDKYMVLQPASYRDQAGSCFALDRQHRLFEEFGGTLREYYMRTRRSSAIADSPLCLCLGVAAMVVCAEGEREYLLQVKRSSKLASLENSYGPSVAGSVDFKSDCTTLMELLQSALQDELREEVRIGVDEAEIIPLAYAREIFRGERPQLFGLVRTKLSRSELSGRLESMESTEREFADYGFLLLSGGRLREEDVAGYNFEARMNYRLAEEYFGQ